MGFTATLGFTALILLIFIVDTFVLVPKNVKKLSWKHLIVGDQTGYITKALNLSYKKIKKGQVWRLVTQIFLHAGFPHMISNTFAILFLGYAVETYLGTGKTAICFLFSSFFSGIVMCFICKNEDGVGASTGLYGLIAMYMLIAIKEQSIMFSALPLIPVIFIGIYTVGGMLLGKVIFREHVSGFVGGMIISPILLFVI